MASYFQNSKAATDGFVSQSELNGRWRPVRFVISGLGPCPAKWVRSAKNATGGWCPVRLVIPGLAFSGIGFVSQNCNGREVTDGFVPQNAAICAQMASFRKIAQKNRHGPQFVRQIRMIGKPGSFRRDGFVSKKSLEGALHKPTLRKRGYKSRRSSFGKTGRRAKAPM
jgi:hypothetical protein